jgi:hypothetical protein
VGPFNVTRDRKNDDLASIAEYGHHPVIRWLSDEVARQNHGGFYFNPNPRCMLAIELEYSTSSKHILGGITNARLPRAIGVIVGPQPSSPRFSASLSMSPGCARSRRRTMICLQTSLASRKTNSCGSWARPTGGRPRQRGDRPTTASCTAMVLSPLDDDASRAPVAGARLRAERDRPNGGAANAVLLPLPQE